MPLSQTLSRGFSWAHPRILIKRITSRSINDVWRIMELKLAIFCIQAQLSLTEPSSHGANIVSLSFWHHITWQTPLTEGVSPCPFSLIGLFPNFSTLSLSRGSTEGRMDCSHSWLLLKVHLLSMIHISTLSHPVLPSYGNGDDWPLLSAGPPLLPLLLLWPGLGERWPSSSCRLSFSKLWLTWLSESHFCLHSRCKDGKWS